MTNHLKLYVLPFCLFSILVAAAQPIPEAFEPFANCEKNDCQEEYTKALNYAEALGSDTATARHFLIIAALRKDLGLWDDEVDNLFLRAIDLYEKSGDVCGQVQALHDRSAHFISAEDDDLGLDLAEQAMELVKECDDKWMKARVYGTLGIAYQNLGEYASALKAHTEEDRLFRELGDKEGQAVSTQEMAYIYASMGDMDRANAMMLASAKIYKEIGLDMRYASCIADLCANYLSLEWPDSVLKRLPEVREIFQGKYVLGEVVTLYNMGEAYMQKEEYDKALALYDECWELGKDLNFPRFYLEVEISRSQCYTGMGEHETAYEHILSAETYAEETTNAEGLMNIHQFKMTTAHEVGEYEASHESALAYIDLKDSLRSIARDEQVAAMQEEFEAEKREHQIALLEREAELEDQRRNGLILIIGLVIVAAIFIINREVQRRKKARQLHEAELQVKETNERLLREELEFKKRELATKVLHISQKNEVLEGLREELQRLSNSVEADNSVRDVLNQLKIERSIDNNWEDFTRQFQEVNPEFYRRLSERAPEMTKNELRLAALLRMNLSSKEIAAVLNITNEGVKKARHRFRKKLELESEDSLERFILSL